MFVLVVQSNRSVVLGVFSVAFLEKYHHVLGMCRSLQYSMANSFAMVSSPDLNINFIFSCFFPHFSFSSALLPRPLPLFVILCGMFVTYGLVAVGFFYSCHGLILF